MPNINWNGYVIDLLKSHNSRMRMIGVLRYELQNPEKVTSQDMIEALSYSYDDSAARSEGYISDRTHYIALSFREETARLNEETIREPSATLYMLEQKEARLMCYIAHLDKRQATAVRLRYFDKKSREESAEELGVSERTVTALVSQAINTLAEMYRITSPLY